MLRLSAVMVLMALMLSIPAHAADLAAAPVMVAAEQNESVEGATPADRSPLEDLNPADSSWKVWAGPIVLGLFAIALVFLIRRFSLGGKNGPRGGRGGD